MLSKNVEKAKQFQVVSIDQLVPEDHILRKIDEAVDALSNLYTKKTSLFCDAFFFVRYYFPLLEDLWGSS